MCDTQLDIDTTYWRWGKLCDCWTPQLYTPDPPQTFSKCLFSGTMNQKIKKNPPSGGFKY